MACLLLYEIIGGKVAVMRSTYYVVLLHLSKILGRSTGYEMKGLNHRMTKMNVAILGRARLAGLTFFLLAAAAVAFIEKLFFSSIIIITISRTIYLVATTLLLYLIELYIKLSLSNTLIIAYNNAIFLLIR